MTQKRPDLEEIEARIAEAVRWGDDRAAKFARWQREWVRQQFAERMKRVDAMTRRKIRESAEIPA